MLADRIKHLTEQEIAMCAEAVMEQRFSTMPAALQEHLEQCDQCSAEVAMVADIGDGDRKESQLAGKTVSFSRWIVPLLAAAVLLGFVLWVIIPSQNPGNGDSAMLAVEQKNDEDQFSEVLPVDESEIAGNEIADVETDLSAAPETSQEALVDETQNGTVEAEREQGMKAPQSLLASFTPDPDMERLVDNYRSAYRGGEVLVKTPSFISLAGYSRLEWSNPGNAALRVQITDNLGNEFFSAATTSTSIDIPEMQPGLYYWRLIEEDDFDLLFAGKILVDAKD